MMRPFVSNVFLAVLAASLGWAGGDLRPRRLKVASLSTVLSDVARNVGGDKIQVEEIVKGGVDPHEFVPSPSDVQLVADAGVVLVSGKGMEGYLSKLEEGTETEKVRQHRRQDRQFAQAQGRRQDHRRPALVALGRQRQESDRRGA